VSKALTVI